MHGCIEQACLGADTVLEVLSLCTPSSKSVIVGSVIVNIVLSV